VTRTFGHFPFGETWYETGTASKLKFTSYERDSESANDYAIMRSHVNRLGRFSSPDPLSGHLGNPQSLNRYAHTLSDPINLIDPFGAQAITTIGEPHPPRGPLTGGGSGGTPDKLILGLGPEASGAGCPLCVPPPQPPPPPGYEECKAALAVAHKDFDAVERAEGAADVIRGAASANGVDPNLLAAVGVRESGWSNILEHGGGQGAGIFQIDLGAHPDAAAFARIPGQAANYAAGLLRTNYDHFESRYNADVDTTTAYATSAYNRWARGRFGGGPMEQAVLGTAPFGIYGPLDTGTANNNYASNVLGLRNCFNF